ncbi:MAG: transcription antitermination factor NusB [Candidatus Saccharibacteria bacterium]|nr:transcription antitermination factor NusB [Candidatus Saccharibacteria bacterium]
MASNRHLGRIIALQTLYEYEFRQEVGDTTVTSADILQRNLTKYKSSIDDIAFVRSLTDGVIARVATLDEKLRPLAPEWPLEQIARIDRAVLRLGLYELLYSDDVPPKVVINEAVELAKAFGSDNSGKFVNGVLGTAFRTLKEDADNEKQL